MGKLRNLIAAVALLSSVPAFAQQGIPFFPQTLNPNTVVGRLSSGPGPTEEIPFTSLLAALFPVGSAAYPFNAASVAFQGSVSGTVTVQAQAAAGTWSLRWPTSQGVTNQCLKTTASGSIATTSWANCAFLDANNTWTGTQTFNGNLTVASLANFTGTFQKNGTTETFPASGSIVGTSDTQTLTNKSIDAGQLTGTIANARLSAGISTNTLQAKTANYPIANTDCGTTISGSGGPWTLTLPAVAGFPTTCVVQACNADSNDNTHHAIKLSGFPSPSFSRLYMQQCLEVSIENGAWSVTKWPGRFRPAFTPTLFVDTGGSSSNDGFVSNAAANALNTIQTCFSILLNEYDLVGTQPVCSPTASQTNTASATITGQLVGSIVINITGNGGVATLRPTASGAAVIAINDWAPGIIFTNVTIDCTGGSASCIGVALHQSTVIDIGSGVTFNGNAAGHSAITCDGGCFVNGNSNFTFSGSFNNGIAVANSSVVVISNGVALANNTTFSNNIFSISKSSSFTFSGALTAGTTVNVAQIITVLSNGTACFGGFTTSGTFTGARQWAVLNGGFLANISANAIPGSAGISTGATFANGVLANSGLNSGGC